MYLLRMIFLGFLVSFGNDLSSGRSYYVSPSGSNSADGSQDTPWGTIQYAVDHARPPATIFLRAGVYHEQVAFNQSNLSLMAYPDESPVIDGGTLTVDSGWDPLVDLNGQRDVIVDGLEIRNFRTALRDHVPMGVLVRGGSKNIQLRNLKIHDIETNYDGSSGGDAHGLAVYGDSSVSSVSNLLIDRVEIYDCRLGSSESMVLNGNVEYFSVENCRIHDNNNIGIDFIGYEGTCAVDALDQARDGACVDNVVSNIVTVGNPAYGSDRSSDGIYVDGGTRIVIERNVVHDCDIGIEIASEHSGRSTSHIMVRNNWIYRNYTGGIFVGGYDAQRGKAEQCEIIGNTLWENDTGMAYNGEIYLQMYVENCRFENNLIVPLINDGKDAVFIGGIGVSGSEPVNTVFNYNLYFSSVSDTDHHLWTWGNTEYYSFSDWQLAGQDAQAVHQQDPLLSNPQSGDFHLNSGSPAIDAGVNSSSSGATDIDRQIRINNEQVDIGADEYIQLP